MFPIPQSIHNDPFVSKLRAETRKLRQENSRLDRFLYSRRESPAPHTINI